MAAKCAGFSDDAKQTGEKLRCKKEVTDEISRLIAQRRKTLANMATAGYYRLAFGNIADAVSLLFEENPTRERLGEMDLFLVSEIKRPKDGTMEIKFFDRLKALEHLETKTEEETTAMEFFDAIGDSARNAGEKIGD